MATALNIIDDALLEIGVLTQPGQTSSIEHAALGLSRLNQLVGEWNISAQLRYCVDRFQFNIATSQASYTIGPSGADWIAPRPNGEGTGKGILKANCVVPGSTMMYFPIHIMSFEQFSQLSIRDIDTRITVALYNDGAYPNSTVSVYGNPSTSYDIEIWVRHQASEFASTGTTFEMPPGYQKAMTQTLAENMASIPAFARYGASWSQLQADNARKARAAVSMNNSAVNPQSNDAAGLGRNTRSFSGYDNRRGGWI